VSPHGRKLGPCGARDLEASEKLLTIGHKHPEVLLSDDKENENLFLLLLRFRLLF